MSDTYGTIYKVTSKTLGKCRYVGTMGSEDKLLNECLKLEYALGRLGDIVGENTANGHNGVFFVHTARYPENLLWEELKEHRTVIGKDGRTTTPMAQELNGTMPDVFIPNTVEHTFARTEQAATKLEYQARLRDAQERVRDPEAYERKQQRKLAELNGEIESTIVRRQKKLDLFAKFPVGSCFASSPGSRIGYKVERHITGPFFRIEGSSQSKRDDGTVGYPRDFSFTSRKGDSDRATVIDISEYLEGVVDISNLPVGDIRFIAAQEEGYIYDNEAHQAFALEKARQAKVRAFEQYREKLSYDLLYGYNRRCYDALSEERKRCKVYYDNLAEFWTPLEVKVQPARDAAFEAERKRCKVYYDKLVALWADEDYEASIAKACYGEAIKFDEPYIIRHNGKSKTRVTFKTPYGTDTFDFDTHKVNFSVGDLIPYFAYNIVAVPKVKEVV